MPTLTEAVIRQGSIMVVDDNPSNLKLLEDMLHQHGYEIRLLPRGRLAVAAAEQEPPDLILLDINMPEMNGYDVCRVLKSNPRLADIPVIFLSALDSTEDKVKGFQAGGIDYISKPFQFEEVEARVETQLQVRRARQAEHDLLERTLGGAVGTLWELVQLTSPMLALRSGSIRNIVLWITGQTAIADPWQYNLAATLCLVGCLALPDDVFERAYTDREITPNEDRMFRAHPERGAQLLSKIPRLETVSEIIRGQLKPELIPHSLSQARLGAEMLHLALALDRRIYQGMELRCAVANLKSSGRFAAQAIAALETYSPAEPEFENHQLPIQNLQARMVLQQDVFSDDGKLLILREGTVLTDTWIERLENFAKYRSTKELLEVSVPTFGTGTLAGDHYQAKPGFIPGQVPTSERAGATRS